MANWDSPDLLSRLTEILQLPVDDSGNIVSQQTGANTTALYRNLSTAEADVFYDLAARVPHALIGAPILMASSDGGYTYPFTDGNSTSITPSGHIRLYVLTTDIPDSPLIEGIDYTIEGTKIRIPNGRTWPFSSGPYVQLINDPIALSASVNPTIPTPARMAVVYQAAVNFCQMGGKQDASIWEKRYNDEIAKLCLIYHTSVAPRVSAGAFGRSTRMGLLGYWGGR